MVRCPLQLFGGHLGQDCAQIQGVAVGVLQQPLDYGQAGLLSGGAVHELGHRVLVQPAENQSTAPFSVQGQLPDVEKSQ
ncbi:hypothetical protein OHA61_01050 [Streptomyces sp. NBC_00885]|uniref:hypothetical protein n=1 Tax=Streptomyces sp. NBC_00885 TaxID=2975857 RepID=UPI003863D43E|nr:hypothetical protein OHA61_01050 [Streptomyces sp. NBC_00885]